MFAAHIWVELFSYSMAFPSQTHIMRVYVQVEETIASNDKKM